MRAIALGVAVSFALKAAPLWAAAAAVPPGAGAPAGKSAAAPKKASDLKEMGCFIGAAEGTVEARVNIGAPWKRVQLEQRLEQGTFVRTGANSSAVIAFSDGSKVRLGANASFRLEQSQPSSIAVFMGLGKLDAWVSKFKKRRFQARNAVAVASVRGTVFSMNVISPTQAQLFCFSGGLGVTDNFGRTVAVGAGQSLGATSQGGAGAPAALPPGMAPPAEPPVDIPGVPATSGAAGDSGGDEGGTTTEAAAEDAPPADEPPAEVAATDASNEPPPANPQQDTNAIPLSPSSP